MVLNVIHGWARSRPTKIALIHDDVPLTYAALVRGVESARRFLATHQLPAGQTAAVYVSNLRDCWIVVLALRALGLDTICLQLPAQLKLLQLRSVDCVVATQAEQDRGDLDGPVPGGARLVVVPAATLADVATGDASMARDPAGPLGGHILHTSGSTGLRKKVLLDAASEDRANANRAEVLSYDMDTVHHGLDFGLWTGVGFKQSAAVWHAGGCVVLDQRADGLKNFLAHGVNRARILPPMLKGILDAADKSQVPRDDLEIGTGGVLFPVELAERCIARLTTNLKIAYSTTELGATPMQSQFRVSDDLHWLVPVGDRVIQVVDNNGVECPAGREGALRIRTTAVDCTSYVDDAAATARAFRDGFFYPGDLAVKRADGRVRILGRLDDVINMGGQKVAAAPLEQQLQRHLRVAEVCLFTRAFGEGKQELTVAIETDRELPAYELDAVAAEFSSFDRVRFSVLREFPRTGTGTRKTQRHELKKRVFAETSPLRATET